MPRWLVIHTKGDISVGVILNRRHAQLVNNGLDYLQKQAGAELDQAHFLLGSSFQFT